jgi:hypothetical protein
LCLAEQRLAQNKDQWQAAMNVVIGLRISFNIDNFEEFLNGNQIPIPELSRSAATGQDTRTNTHAGGCCVTGHRVQRTYRPSQGPSLGMDQ